MVTSISAPLSEGEIEHREMLARLSRLPLSRRNEYRLYAWIERPGMEQAWSVVLDFVNDKLDPPTLFLCGTPRLGKTHLAQAIGWYYLSKGRSVWYWQVQDFLDALVASYKRPRTEPGEVDLLSFESLMNRAKKVCLFILDDFGAHNDTEHAGSHLDMIVNYRHENKLAMVLTGNTLEISDRVLGRCREGRLVLLKGEEFTIWQQAQLKKVGV